MVFLFSVMVLFRQTVYADVIAISVPRLIISL